jgi:hypothetical protein
MRNLPLGSPAAALIATACPTIVKKQAEVQAQYDWTIVELEKKWQACEKEMARLREMQKN